MTLVARIATRTSLQAIPVRTANTAARRTFATNTTPTPNASSSASSSTSSTLASRWHNLSGRWRAMLGTCVFLLALHAYTVPVGKMRRSAERKELLEKELKADAGENFH